MNKKMYYCVKTVFLLGFAFVIFGCNNKVNNMPAEQQEKVSQEATNNTAVNAGPENEDVEKLNKLKSAREFDKLIESGNKFLKDDPKNTDIMRLMSEAYLIKGDIAESEKLYLKALSFEPDNAFFSRMLGEINIDKKDNEKAIQYFQNATTSEDKVNVMWAYSGLSRVYKMMNNKVKAEQMLKKALEIAENENDKKAINDRYANLPK